MHFLDPTPDVLGTLNFNKGSSCLRVSKLHASVLWFTSTWSRILLALGSVRSSKITYSGVTSLKWEVGNAESFPKMELWLGPLGYWFLLPPRVVPVGLAYSCQQVPPLWGSQVPAQVWVLPGHHPTSSISSPRFSLLRLSGPQPVVISHSQSHMSPPLGIWVETGPAAVTPISFLPSHYCLETNHLI